MGERGPVVTPWRKAKESNSTGNCVEWAIAPDGVKVRDSKQGKHSPVLMFTFSEWTVFVRAVKAGEADLIPSYDPNPEEEWVSLLG
ncbi:DUF397 domain-containing protein [Sphaerimonospora cavernae]|uniref:DUF397 domain-containing protein n=1 Tax=Sphaerimonospora cavernae TaxID=1740611 RepID=A0ABV6U0H1_9ACTN